MLIFSFTFVSAVMCPHRLTVHPQVYYFSQVLVAQVKETIKPKLDSIHGRAKAAMGGLPLWQRLVNAYRFTTVPKYFVEQPIVQSNMNPDGNGQGKRYRDIHMDGLHIYAPAANVKPSATALAKLVRDSMDSDIHQRTTVEQVRLFAVLEDWLRVLVDRWTEEQEADGCSGMVLERAHLTLEDAVKHRNVYESIVIQARFSRLSTTFRLWYFVQKPALQFIFNACSMGYIACAFIHNNDTRMIVGWILVFPFTFDLISGSVWEFQVYGTVSKRTFSALMIRIAIWICQIISLAAPDVRSNSNFILCQNLLRPLVLINKNPNMGELWDNIAQIRAHKCLHVQELDCGLWALASGMLDRALLLSSHSLQLEQS